MRLNLELILFIYTRSIEKREQYITTEIIMMGFTTVRLYLSPEAIYVDLHSPR